MGYRVDKMSDNKNAMCKEYQGSNMFSKPTLLYIVLNLDFGSFCLSDMML